MSRGRILLSTKLVLVTRGPIRPMQGPNTKAVASYTHSKSVRFDREMTLWPGGEPILRQRVVVGVMAGLKEVELPPVVSGFQTRCAGPSEQPGKATKIRGLRPSVPVGVKLVGTCHGNSYRGQGMEDPDGLGMGLQNLRKPFVTMGGFVASRASEFYAHWLNPIEHHLATDLPLGDSDETSFLESCFARRLGP